MKISLDRLFGAGKTPRQPAPPAAAAPRIAFDRQSLIIGGQRVVVRSGAFHYFRLPAPNLWRDRLLKIKRAGYNTVDLYFAWSYHSPAEGVYDFSGPRDVDRLLDLCREVGLYVIARPGPFINAELDGGGHPAWLLAKPGVHLRCLDGSAYADSPSYRAYAQQWYEQIVPRIARYDNVILFQIENEYTSDDMNPAYMHFLFDLARRLGVSVPIIHNDIWGQGCWADLVDIYGIDNYAFTTFGEDWRGQNELLQGIDSVGDVRAYCPRSPLAIYELQGGWFSGWTGISYDDMRGKLGREALNLVTWSALAQGVTIYNHYMFAGGANWDHIGAPVVQTSYDYAAPLREWGGLSQRYYAAKAIATVVGAFEELFAASEESEAVQASEPSLLYKTRTSNGAYLVFLRNLSGETRSTTVSAGGLTSGPVTVGPYDMRLVMLNLPMAEGRVSSTCHVFTRLEQENQHVLVLYGAGQIICDLPAPPRILRAEAPTSAKGRRVTITYDGQAWQDVVFSASGHRYRFALMPTSDNAWQVGEHMVVGASYVGEDRMKGGQVDLPRRELRVQTASSKKTTLRIYSAGHLNRIEINDEMILASDDNLAGYMRFDMPGAPPVALPALGPWRVQPVPLDEDGEAWRSLPQGTALDMDSLGMYRGFAWYRAHYSGRLSELRLAIRHNAAVYLNGRFVVRLDNYQSEQGDTESESEQVEPDPIALPAALQTDGENVLDVIVESLGHNKGYLHNERLARGLLAAEAAVPLRWSVRAGLPGEAEGFAVPEHDDTLWVTAGEAFDAEGELVWARTRFTLDMPEHVFAPIALCLQGVADKAHVYLNGTLIARDWSACAERRFYLPEGVLEAHGKNTLALLLWRRGERPDAGRSALEAYAVESSNHVNVL